MKKLIMILIILESALYCQNTGVPGKDFFPYMSFWDFAVYQSHPRQSSCTSSQYATAMQQSSRLYYYPLLVNLGLTNIVSDFDLINTLHMSDYYGSIKFLDMDFSWAGDDSPPFEPGRYLKATGNNPDFFAHQIGGDWDMTWNPDNKNFGFGTDTKSSRWAMDSTKKPTGSPTLTGIDTSDAVPPSLGSSQIRYAKRGRHSAGGTLFYGTIDAGHFPHKYIPYQLSFFIRGDQKELAEEVDPSAVVLRIYVIAGGSIYQKPYNKNIGVEEPNFTEDDPIYFLEEPFEITGEDLMLTSGSYRWITTPSFQIPGNVNITYYAVWTGAASIYCDRMIMFNEFYDIIFNPTQKPNPVTPPNFGGQISAKYPTVDSTLHSTYVDEPPLLAAEAFGKINHLVDSVIGTRNGGMELNGAIGPHTEWGMRFEQKFGISPFDDKYKRKYLLYNVYPFRQELTTTQSDVQSAIEELINYRFIGDTPDSLSYQFLGLKPAIRASSLYDSDPGNDIPWISILQVHAEHNVYKDGGQYKIDRTATNMRRAPTKDEIFVQGNMALAYGAKGFMVYMVPTWNAAPGEGEGDTVWNTYGLFDQSQNPYLGVDGSGLVQHPCSAQVPNTRYDAVKDLFAETKKIENVILNLNWLDAKYWNENSAIPKPWISEIETSPTGSFPVNPTDPPMVQTGYFEEYSHLAGYNPKSKYIYIVNRRCNTQGSDNSNRYIRFKIDSTVASNYTNIKVTNMKTGQTFFTSKNSLFTLFLNAGDGTLLKFEPTILAGGLLVENETVSSSIEVDSSLELSQYKKLRIENGADVTFKNSSRLYVYNSDLEIEGTPSNPSVINFVSPNWTLGNGLVARYADVSINNARIKNASAGIYGYRCSTFVVSNTIIDSCYFGISMEEMGSPYGTNVLNNLTLNRCNTRGITTTDATLMAKDVVISGGENAMMFTNSEFNCFLMQDTANINILNHTTGVYSNNSLLNFGYDDGYGFTDGRYNTFLSAENFFIENNSFVMAQYAWWDSKSNYCDYTSTLIDEPSFKYEGDNPLILPNEEPAMVKQNSTSEGGSVLEKYELAIRMYKKGHLRQAREICGEIIDNNSNSEYIPAVISLLIRTFKEEGKEALGQYLSNGNNASPNSTAKGLLQAATALFTEDVNTVYDDIITRYPGKYPAEYSLYKKALYQNGSQMDKKGAKTTFGKLRTDFPNSLFIKDLEVRLADTMGFSNKSVLPLGLPKQQAKTLGAEIYDYNLYNNYPNPFNPETVIKFSLKEKSSVTLTVYSITGQKVAELVNGEMEKGFYEKKFDGTKLSSGVYIFRIEAQSLESKTTYSKTVKALLLK